MHDMIFTKLEDLPLSIGAFTKENADGSYTIVVNSRKSREDNFFDYLHEVYHINHKDFEYGSVGEIESNCRLKLREG